LKKTAKNLKKLLKNAKKAVKWAKSRDFSRAIFKNTKM
jgi:hypothetical protein